MWKYLEMACDTGSAEAGLHESGHFFFHGTDDANIDLS